MGVSSDGPHNGRFIRRHGARVFVDLPIVYSFLRRVETRLLKWQRRQIGESAAGAGPEGAAGGGQRNSSLNTRRAQASAREQQSLWTYSNVQHGGLAGRGIWAGLGGADRAASPKPNVQSPKSKGRKGDEIAVGN